MKLQVRIGRIAGQYAKPRSSAMEKIGDREVLSFRYRFPPIACCCCHTDGSNVEETTLMGAHQIHIPFVHY